MDSRYKRKMERFWAREFKRAKTVVDSVQSSEWFDFWHTHLDWKSKGNRYPESRANVARLTYELLLYAESKVAQRTKPIQVFAQIHQDTGSNAVYLHSENSNGTEFPYQFENFEWSVETPPELIGVVDIKTHEIGRVQYEDGVVYAIRFIKNN
jgi:hypothetical protein